MSWARRPTQTWDPRSSRRYRDTRRAWLPHAEPVCCLCGGPVDLGLPAGLPASPTVEHTLPIRTILAMARSRAEAVELACDTSAWRTAHHRCQSLQGARVGGLIATASDRKSSREW